MSQGVNQSVVNQPVANQQMVSQAVSKCARFFKTLLHLSEKQVSQQQQSPTTIKTVRQLVRGVVFGALAPEQFTVRLQQALNSQAQQNLLPFLRQTLPALRTALQNGEQVIEGIGTSEEYWAEAEQNSQITDVTQPEKISSAVPEPNVPSGGYVNDTEADNVQPSISNPPSQKVVTGPILTNNFPHTLLDAQTILNRIYAKMPEVEIVDNEVLTLISSTVEGKLRELSTKLSMVAEHRLEPLRLNPHYYQTDDPRKQLQCVEEVERRVFERRETIEREALIKISKSKGKDKDTMERVKQIQKADKEAALNREANEAAIAALGGMRGTKRPNSASNFHQPLNSRFTLQTHKPRIKRITGRDLTLVLSKDTYGSSTNLYYKLCYSDDNKNFN